MNVTKANVWDVLSDPTACSEAATAGQRLLDSLDDAGESIGKVIAEVSEIVPEIAGDSARALADLDEACDLIGPTVSRLRELGR